MADLLRAVSDVVWEESFWLPNNSSWDVLKNIPGGVYHAQFKDLLVPFFLSVVVQVVKYIFEEHIFGSIGRAIGLKSVVKKATPNPILEYEFMQSKSPSKESLQTLSKQTELTSRQIERWFRVRRNQDRTPIYKKFCESGWRFIFYFFIFWWGLYIHLDKPWFYETLLCWKGWPEHHLTSDIYWYYMIEGAFYLSLLFSLFTDHKRKDFVEMIVHHVVTVMLMTLSWVNNFFRIGTLVLLVHDAVDSWMEAAKMAKYMGYDRLCECLFFMFVIIWVLTRMTIFPFRIIYSTMFEALPGLNAKDISMISIYSVYNFLLCSLQVLHIIWFYYISLIAYQALLNKQIDKDSRSSQESSSGTDHEHADKQDDDTLKKGEKSRNGVVKLKKRKT